MAKGRKRRLKADTETPIRNNRTELTTKRWTIIGSVGTIVAILVTIAIFVIPNIPSPNLQVDIISGASVIPTYDTNHTSLIGINVTIPTVITNVGNIPIHIAACEVFMSENGKPSWDSSTVSIGEVKYLQQDESFTYNFTKYFQISMPNNLTYQQMIDLTTKYFLDVFYYTYDQNDYQQYWVNIDKKLDFENHFDYVTGE